MLGSGSIFRPTREESPGVPVLPGVDESPFDAEATTMMTLVLWTSALAILPMAAGLMMELAITAKGMLAGR